MKKPILDSIEFRVAKTGSAKLAARKLSGYAAVFNVYSSPELGFMEVIRPGAFTKTLKESDIRALWNHNSDMVLGRNKSGTLRLVEDEQGLAYEIDLPNNTAGNDCHETVARGDVNQSSFRFRTIKDNWFIDDAQGGALCRELLEVRLMDVSPTTFPAYEATSVSARAIAQAASDVAGKTDETLFKALMRLKRGEELRDEERALLMDFAGNLQKQLKPTEPAPSHSEPPKPPEARHSVEDLRRKLELLEIETNGGK